ncbi:MAG TPA: hypothetical protein VFT16_03170 [Candidatus Saccharimonadales bacterium]|nr:hypothetical protein [Candidatus Saccharimonadales bacterium]
MESMTAPTYMHPGEPPEEVLQRLITYVNQEQLNQGPTYEQVPNAYQPSEYGGYTPGRHAQHDTSPPIMEPTQVPNGIRRFAMHANPIEPRRPAHAAPVRDKPHNFDDSAQASMRPQQQVEPTGEVEALPETRYRRSAAPHTTTGRQPRRRGGRSSVLPDGSTGFRYLSEEELDRRFDEFMKGWDEPNTPPRESFRHRRQISRIEKISARLGLGLGFLAMAATVAYSGFELYSRARGQ